jgi:hypothetical protein
LVFGRFKTGQGPMAEEIIWQGTFGEGSRTKTTP